MASRVDCARVSAANCSRSQSIAADCSRSKPIASRIAAVGFHCELSWTRIAQLFASSDSLHLTHANARAKPVDIAIAIAMSVSSLYSRVASPIAIPIAHRQCQTRASSLNREARFPISGRCSLCAHQRSTFGNNKSRSRATHKSRSILGYRVEFVAANLS